MSAQTKRNVVQEVMGYQPPALLISNYARKYEVSETEAIHHFEECKKFLVICGQNPKESYAPSAIIDEMWHSFVLYTKEYAGFCNHYFQRFIHHIPSSGPSFIAYQQTLQALWSLFGQPDPKYWPSTEAGDCSSPSECGGGGGSGEGGCSSRCTGD